MRVSNDETRALCVVIHTFYLEMFLNNINTFLLFGVYLYFLSFRKLRNEVKVSLTNNTTLMEHQGRFI